MPFPPRRKRFRSAAALVLGLAGLSCAAALARADWTDLHGTENMAGNRDSNTRWQRTPMVAPPLRLRWKHVNWHGSITPFVTPTPVQCQTTQTCTPTGTAAFPPQPYNVVYDQYPVIAYGNVYLVSKTPRRAYAWNLATGSPIPAFWQKPGPPGVNGYGIFSPTLAYGRLYYATGNSSSASPMLHAVDAFTADPVPGFPASFAGECEGAPVVRDGRVFLGLKATGGPGGSILALNAFDGSVAWSWYAPFGQFKGSGAVAQNRVVFGSDAYGVFCFDATTGALAWAQNAGGDILGAPAIANGVVYVGTLMNSIRAYDLVTGAPRVGFPVMGLNPWGEFENGLAIADGWLYSGSFDFGIYSWNAASGAGVRPGWPAFASSHVHSCPAVCDGVVYIGADDNTLRAINAQTARIEWSYAIPREWISYGSSYPFEGFNRSSVAISDGVVVAVSNEGNGIYVFEPAPTWPAPQPTRVILHTWDNLVVPGQNTVLFTWDLPADYSVRLSIYNPAGEHIRTLFEGNCPGAECYAVWDGRAAGGSRIASGVYVAALAVRGRGVYRTKVAVLNQTIP